MNEQQQYRELIDWLEADEARSRPYRAARLQTLLETLKLPEAGMMLWGGSASLHALTEMRLAYIHGLHLSTIFLALTFIERELAGSLYATGSDKAANARFQDLLTEATARTSLEKDESDALSQLRQVRNAYAHYRSILHPMHDARRAVKEDTPMDELLERDALEALRSVAAYIRHRNRAS